MKKQIIIGASIILGVTIISLIQKRKSIPKKRLQDLVGNTPLIYLKALSLKYGREIYAKCEFLNPCGSMKDRVALALLNARTSDLIYEGTSGSTGVSLALLGNSMGCKTKVFLPDDLAEEKYSILKAVGAEIVKVKPCSIVDSNHFCKLAESSALKDGACYTNQFHNLKNYQMHYQTGKEIYQQTNGIIDCFVMSAGTGGAIAGISQYLKKKNKKIKVVLADPPGSSLKNHVNFKVCYTSEESEGHRLKHPYDTIVEGVGQNRLTQNYLQAKIDYAFTIEDKETIEMSQFLIKEEGLFVGSSSAMNCVAVTKAINEFPECKVFVTILCDSGQRYMSKFYNRIIQS